MKKTMLDYFAQENQEGVLDLLKQEGYINDYIYTPWMFENLTTDQVVNLTIRLCENCVLGTGTYSLEDVPRYVVEWHNGALTAINPEHMLYWFEDDINEVAQNGLGVYASQESSELIDMYDIEHICSNYEIEGCSIWREDNGSYNIQLIDEDEPIYDLVGLLL